MAGSGGVIVLGFSVTTLGDGADILSASEIILGGGVTTFGDGTGLDFDDIVVFQLVPPSEKLHWYCMVSFFCWVDIGLLFIKLVLLFFTTSA